ncbi:hypothetical protein SCUCBS95973_009822 [Sporothrix curviconia]|uniref:Uncharacterized protein n=1 Tax=Sporothrix curviconia TaxID=1260050 RepID=A0ABP0CY39_9PEZI
MPPVFNTNDRHAATSAHSLPLPKRPIVDERIEDRRRNSLRDTGFSWPHHVVPAANPHPSPACAATGPNSWSSWARARAVDNWMNKLEGPAAPSPWMVGSSLFTSSYPSTANPWTAWLSSSDNPFRKT